MKKVTDKQQFFSNVRNSLDMILKIEANSASCGVMFEPESPKELSKFKRKNKSND